MESAEKLAETWRRLGSIAAVLEIRWINRKLVPEESREPELTPIEYLFLTVFEFWNEINAGDYSEYLTNTDGDYASFLPIALAAVGASRTSSLVRRATAEIGHSSLSWEDIDEDLSSLLLAFVETHRGELPDPSEFDSARVRAAQKQHEAWQEERRLKIATIRRAKESERDNFLHRARVGDLADVRAALDKNPSLVYAKKPHTEETALHLAARHGHVEVVRLLLERRASPNEQAIERYSPRTAALWAIGNPHRGTTDEKQQQIAELIYKAGGR